MKKLACAFFLLIAAACLYAAVFPYLLAQRSQIATKGQPYCIVVPVTEPEAFAGWTVNTCQRLQKVADFNELSLIDIVLRRLRGRAESFRYTQPIHFGIVSQGRAYHWSFAAHNFVENDSYTDFRREFNRDLDFPAECALPDR